MGEIGKHIGITTQIQQNLTRHIKQHVIYPTKFVAYIYNINANPYTNQSLLDSLTQHSHLINLQILLQSTPTNMLQGPQIIKGFNYNCFITKTQIIHLILGNHHKLIEISSSKSTSIKPYQNPKNGKYLPCSHLTLHTTENQTSQILSLLSIPPL
jgi:hypothetical protein